MNNEDVKFVCELVNQVDDSDLDIKKTDEYKNFSKKIKLIAKQIEEVQKYQEIMKKLQDEIDTLER